MAEAGLRQRIGAAGLVSIGAGLARRGPLAVISIVICAVTIVVAAGLAGSMAGRGDAPAHDMPLVASSAIAWGGGFLLAFSVAVGAFQRDRAEGVRHLFVMRTSVRGYLAARVGGLAALLAVIVGGGTLLVGLIAVLAAARIHTVAETTQSTFAAVLYALAFAAVVAPVAFAALGARTRFSGYLYLIAVLVAPEVLGRLLGGRVAADVLEVCSIPSALAALRASVAPGTVDPLRFLRAGVALTAFGAVAVAWLRRDLERLDREAPT